MASVNVEVNMTELLSAVWDNLTRTYSPWIHHYSFDWENNDGTQSVYVTFDEPCDAGGEYQGRGNTKLVTPEMLLKAFGGMVGHTIWGTVVSHDPEEMDALQADYCLQMAIFGTEMYG